MCVCVCIFVCAPPKTHDMLLHSIALGYVISYLLTTRCYILYSYMCICVYVYMCMCVCVYVLCSASSGAPAPHCPEPSTRANV